MGVLIPEDYDLTLLKNESERVVVRALCEQLSDRWFVIPSRHIATKHRDYELDVIIANQDYGIADIEIKGHNVQIRQGDWYSNNVQMNPQPVAQARANAYTLREKLRETRFQLLSQISVNFAIALPNSRHVGAVNTIDIRPEQLFLADQIAEIESAVLNLFDPGHSVQLSNAEFECAMKIICGDVEFSFDPDANAKRARARLEEMSSAQIRCMETLDANRRVFVSGKAGTGKTRLAQNWVLRALAREERVLFVCFNEPLAATLPRRLPESEDLLVGPFLRVARSLPGMPEIEDLVDPDDEELADFWNVTVAAHLHEHWKDIETTFDTIVVDEAQDFSPAWIAYLEALLDPDGPRRMLMVADADQNVFERGFRAPFAEDGWTLGELVQNCRNTRNIARLLRRVLNGAAAPQEAPDGSGISFVAVSTDAGEVTGAVRDALLDMRTRESAVIGSSKEWREHLRRELGLGTFGDPTRIIPCESFRRLKGTEFDSVVIVDPEGSLDKKGLYIAISRAVNHLSIIGPQSLGQQLGLIA